MRRCAHSAYCAHAPHRCREFLGNPLDYIVGGCPLVPTHEEVEQARAKAGGLTLAAVSEAGGLSVDPSAD